MEYNKQNIRNLKSRNNPPKIKREKKMTKKCLYCGGGMKSRGASDANGGSSWKCSNKKCGRTTWVWKVPVPPIPLVCK